MNLDPAAEAEVIEAFTGEGLLWKAAGDSLRANGPDWFKRWLYGGIQDLGETALTKLLLGGFPRSSSELSWTEWWRGTWAW